MDATVMDQLSRVGDLDASEPPADVADYYARAASRIVVTSKRSFVTSCGQLTGEVMTVNHVQSFDGELETAASMAGLDATDALAEGGRNSASTIFDPEVLLAWLLTEGISTFH